MDYKELVTILRHCANPSDGYCDGCPLFDDGFCVVYDDWLFAAESLMSKAADAIEELFGKVEQLPRWIPVTERLPNPFVNVLVCFDFKGRKSIGVAELWSDDGVFHNYSDEYLTPYGRKHRSWTHWMPLPEPPKEE